MVHRAAESPAGSQKVVVLASQNRACTAVVAVKISPPISVGGKSSRRQAQSRRQCHVQQERGDQARSDDRHRDVNVEAADYRGPDHAPFPPPQRLAAQRQNNQRKDEQDSKAQRQEIGPVIGDVADPQRLRGQHDRKHGSDPVQVRPGTQQDHSAGNRRAQKGEVEQPFLLDCLTQPPERARQSVEQRRVVIRQPMPVQRFGPAKPGLGHEIGIELVVPRP